MKPELLTPKLDDITRKEYYSPISPVNIDAKNPQQNISEPNSTIHLKDHTLWSSGIYSMDARNIQHPQINQSDTSH